VGRSRKHGCRKDDDDDKVEGDDDDEVEGDDDDDNATTERRQPRRRRRAVDEPWPRRSSLRGYRIRLTRRRAGVAVGREMG
jgi:hypothetical protein